MVFVVSAVLALTMILGVLSIQKPRCANRATVDLAPNWMPSVMALGDVHQALSEIRRAELQPVVYGGNKDDADRFQATMAHRFESLKKLKPGMSPSSHLPRRKTSTTIL